MAVGAWRYKHSEQYDSKVLQDHVMACIWKPWVAVAAMKGIHMVA